jgi:hypothetical protein
MVQVQHGVNKGVTISDDGKFPRVVFNVFKYLFTKRGLLAFPAANIGAFYKTAGDTRPSMQIHFTPGAGGMDETRQYDSFTRAGCELHHVRIASGSARPCAYPQH